MIVKDVMTRKVASCQPGSSIRSIAALMKEHDVGCVPVVSDGAIVGLVTDRDICTRGVCLGADPNEVSAADVMTKEGIAAVPQSEPIAVADSMMRDKKVRRLLVTGDDNGLVGIVSIGDLACHAKQGDEANVHETLAEVCG